jgi:hypothetical protein
MTTTYAVSLLLSYASMGAAFSHIFLWNWKELWGAFKGFNFLKSGQDFDEWVNSIFHTAILDTCIPVFISNG